MSAKFAEKLARYLPESGELEGRATSAWEEALLADLLEVGQAVTEARLEVVPLRVPEQARCPRRGLKGVVADRAGKAEAQGQQRQRPARQLRALQPGGSAERQFEDRQTQYLEGAGRTLAHGRAQAELQKGYPHGNPKEPPEEPGGVRRRVRDELRAAQGAQRGAPRVRGNVFSCGSVR